MKKVDIKKIKNYLEDRFYYLDGELYTKYKLNRWPEDHRVGHLRPDGYKEILIYGKLYLLHRLIFLFHHGFLPEMIDHINRDRSDNRIENLRCCDNSINMHNSKVRSDSLSGYRGIHFCKVHGKWKARIQVRGKRISLGYHKDLGSAISARAKAEQELLIEAVYI